MTSTLLSPFPLTTAHPLRRPASSAGMLLLLSRIPRDRQEELCSTLAKQCGADWQIQLVDKLEQINRLIQELTQQDDLPPVIVICIDARDGRFVPNLSRHELPQHLPCIFLTNLPSMAQHAFEYGAVDCVMLPCTADRLRTALARAQYWQALSPAAQSETSPPGETTTVPGRPARWLRMIIHDNGLQVVPLREVLYFQAERKTTRIVTAAANGFVRLGINTVASHVDPDLFWRIHRSIIVNSQHVTTIRQDELGRVALHLRGRAETLFASKVHERHLMRDGLY